MRLLSLIIALVIIGGLVIYNKNSLLPGAHKDPHQTVKEQAQQIIDQAKTATSDLQKNLDEQQKRLQQYNK